eukprot:SAG31_NODE_11636_length_1011_cov_1.077851_2_plen_52_part_01
MDDIYYRQVTIDMRPTMRYKALAGKAAAAAAAAATAAHGGHDVLRELRRRGE